MKRIICLMALCFSVVLPVAANGQPNGAQFSLFDVEGWQVAQTYTFDESYTERYGIEVGVDFQIAVPQNDAIFMIADGAPDGGAFVKFTFGTEGEDPNNRVFLENIQIVTATVPMYPQAEDPELARVQAAAQLLRDAVFPQAVAGFEAPEILALEELQIGDVPRAVHLIGRYVDPSVGPMMLRLAMMVHPDQPESYFAVANINLSHVPVVDAETLRATITGQILSSWTYR